MWAYPDIDPIALQLGPLAIRWYSLAYIAGFLLGWAYILRLTRRHPEIIGKKQLDDLLFWAVLGVIIGGRLGYVLFYNLPYYLHHPAEILAVWQGGMAFHGGMLGIILSVYLFCRKHDLRFLSVMDLVAAAGPIGLFFGRLANFINGELFGRVTGSPFGMIFPQGGPAPRHPSQLYEATLEGLVLFFILLGMIRYFNALEKPGLIGGTFLLGYGLSRFTVEFFREPDPQLGFLFAGATMGQLLSLPMILAGLYFMLRARKPA